MDKDWENMILVVLGIAFAAVLLPTLIPQVRDRVVAELLSYRVVVPAAEAIIQIPTTSVGLDLPRIVMGVGLLVLIGAVSRPLLARRTQER